MLVESPNKKSENVKTCALLLVRPAAQAGEDKAKEDGSWSFMHDGFLPQAVNSYTGQTVVARRVVYNPEDKCPLL